MKIYQRVGLVALVGLIPLVASMSAGCKGTLDPSGVYKGDKVLYTADLSIKTSYDVLHAFVTWESQNRKLIDNAEITKYADAVRLGSPKWVASAIAVRDAYAANPSTGNATALQSALATLLVAVAQASQYLVQSSGGGQ